MSDAPVLLFYLLLLILPISALIARRVSMKTMLKMGAIWVGIFGLGAIITTVIN